MAGELQHCGLNAIGWPVPTQPTEIKGNTLQLESLASSHSACGILFLTRTMVSTMGSPKADHGITKELCYPKFKEELCKLIYNKGKLHQHEEEIRSGPSWDG